MATAKQWAETEGKLPNNIPALRWSMSCCILELRARVEALEHRFDTQRLATLEWGKDVDMVKRLLDKHHMQLEALEAAQQDKLDRLIVQDRDEALEADGPAVSCGREPASVAAQPTPAGSLVERVHSCIVGEPECGHMQARAAIREVAAWLRVELKDHFGSGTYWSQQFEKEAER